MLSHVDSAPQSRRLDPVFRPRSVCLIGVSADPKRLNYAPLYILRLHKFPGDIHLVNPKYDAIDGLPCHRRLEEVPSGIDLAMIMVPAAEVADTLAICADKGMRGAIVLSSGFEEVQGGVEHAARVKKICEERGIALIGPNCEGVWSVAARTMLTFGSAAKREKLHHAPVAMVSQSGAMAGAVARHLQEQGYGCSYIVSVGNETNVTLLEVTDWLLDQEDVKYVLLFMEGLRDGWRLGAIARKARERGITIVALKSGNSVMGAEAAASHTGKIATPYAIYRDIFAQHGILQVESLTDLIEAAQVALLMRPLRRAAGRTHAGVTVCSIPGGTRALTADLCGVLGVPLATFEDKTVKALENLLPRFGYVKNPVDLTAQILSRPELLNDALAIVANDPNTEALIVQFANRGLTDVREREAALAEVAQGQRVPLIVSLLSDEMPAEERRRHAEKGVFVARDPRDAVRWLSWMYATARTEAAGPAAKPAAAKARNVGVPDATWKATVGFLEAAGIGTPAWALLAPGADAARACAALRFPLAVKALPEDVEHKTELGAVVLNVKAYAEVDDAAATIRKRMGKTDCALLVQEMVRDGVEATIAVMRNPDFGAVLAIGSGGVMVELLQDMAYLSLPTTEREIESAIDRLHLARLLAGFRGAPVADRASLVRAAMRLGEAFAGLPPEVTEIELNPVFVRPKGEGLAAVDALVKTGAAA